MASFISPSQLIASTTGRCAKYCLLDARTNEDFSNGHIPGALHIAWESLCASPPSDCDSLLKEYGYWGLLADFSDEEWTERLSGLGLGKSDHIVVYGDGQLSWGAEGRIAWMLLYLGASRVSILDGGYRGWLRAGGQIEHEQIHCNGPSYFDAMRLNNRRASIDEIVGNYNQGNLPLLVDTRSQNEFDGIALDYYQRNGRLPGSILFPFDRLFESDGSFITRDQYLKTAPPEILNAKNLVAYCEVGVRASTFALLHEIYTGRTVPVYDGSIVEWAHYKSLPVLYS